MAEDIEDRDTVALLTPVANGKVLAAVCALNRVAADIIETPPTGSFAVIEDDSEGAVERAAGIMSAFIGAMPMLAMERRAGQLSVTQWQQGEMVKELAPGLALDQAPHAVTKLMSGATTVEELKADKPEVVYSSRMSRWSAFWKLRGYAKQAKREQRDRGSR